MAPINRKIFKDSLVIAVLSFIGQGLGYLVTMLVAKHFGTNSIADAYYLAFVIPGTIVGIAGGIIKIAFIPVFVEERIKRPNNFQNIVGSSVTAIFLISIIGLASVFILALFSLCIPGGNLETIRLARTLVIELLPLIPLTIFVGLLASIYASFQRFGLPEVSNWLNHIIIISTFVALVEEMGIHALVLGHILGQSAAVLLCLAAVYKKLGLNVRPNVKFSSAVRRIWKNSLFPFLSHAVAQLSPLVSRFIATLLPIGSVAIICYAEKLAVLPSIIIGTGFMGVIASYWSKSVAEGNEKELRHSLNSSVSLLITILSPVIVALYFLREELVELLLRRGAFDNTAVNMTAEVFAILIIAVIPRYLHMVICRVFIAKQDYYRLFMVSLVGAAFHPVFSYLFAIVLGMKIHGIALSHLLCAVVIAFATSYLVHSEHVKFGVNDLGRKSLKVIVGCLAMSGAIFLFRNIAYMSIAEYGLPLEIIGVMISGFFVYISLLIFVRHPDVIGIWKIRK